MLPFVGAKRGNLGAVLHWTPLFTTLMRFRIFFKYLAACLVVGLRKGILTAQAVSRSAYQERFF
jgi:hypothetical protein